MQMQANLQMTVSHVSSEATTSHHPLHPLRGGVALQAGGPASALSFCCDTMLPCLVSRQNLDRVSG